MEKDLRDATYRLFTSERRWLDIRIHDKNLSFDGDDFGEDCRIMNGTTEYEFHYSLDEENTRKFLNELRGRFGCERELEEVLTEAFGRDSGSVEFVEFCDSVQVKYSFFSF